MRTGAVGSAAGRGWSLRVRSAWRIPGGAIRKKAQARARHIVVRNLSQRGPTQHTTAQMAAESLTFMIHFWFQSAGARSCVEIRLVVPPASRSQQPQVNADERAREHTHSVKKCATNTRARGHVKPGGRS